MVYSSYYTTAGPHATQDTARSCLLDPYVIGMLSAKERLRTLLEEELCLAFYWEPESECFSAT